MQKTLHHSNQQVLVTGATGFLGAYILKDLLERSNAHVYCLVRAKSESEAIQRLKENCQHLFGEENYNAWAQERISIIVGEIGLKQFGLSDEQYTELANTIDSIVNSAAMLWHYGKKEDFLRINVAGTQDLLDFCHHGKTKTFNHISTLAVSGRRTDNPNNLFTEEDFHENMQAPNLYVETKYEAERILLAGIAKGLPVRIFRPGFVMGDSKTGQFKKQMTGDAQYMHLQGHIYMRTAPPLHDDDYMDITPVDYASASIVYLAYTEPAESGVYHVCNPKPIRKGDIWNLVEGYGYPLRYIPADIYKESIWDCEDELFLQGLQYILIYLEDYEKSPAVFDSTKTQAKLVNSGIVCPPPDKDLLHKYLDYCISVGFLPKPSALNSLAFGK